MKKEPAVGIARGGFEVVTNELWDCECFRGEWWLSLVPPDLVPPDPAPEGDLFPPLLDRVRSLEERGGGGEMKTHTQTLECKRCSTKEDEAYLQPNSTVLARREPATRAHKRRVAHNFHLPG